MNRTIQEIIQAAWNDGDHREPDSFGTFLDAAAAAIEKYYDAIIAAQSIIFAQASERAFREHVSEYESRMKAVTTVYDIEQLRANTSFNQIDIPDCVFQSKEAQECGFTKRSFLEAGWRKLK